MKKFLSVLVALMLALSACVALAEEEAVVEPVPSKTSSDLTEVEALVAEDGTVIDPSVFSLYVDEDSAATIEELKDMMEYYDENGEITSYFDDETLEQILATINENLSAGETPLTLEDLEDWSMNDLISIAVSGTYDPAWGAITATMKVPTPYAVGQKIAAVAITFDGTRTETEPGVYKFNAEYHAVPATVSAVDETGSHIDVNFDAQALTAIRDSVATALAILSEPAE